MAGQSKHSFQDFKTQFTQWQEEHRNLCLVLKNLAHGAESEPLVSLANKILDSAEQAQNLVQSPGVSQNSAVKRKEPLIPLSGHSLVARNRIVTSGTTLWNSKLAAGGSEVAVGSTAPLTKLQPSKCYKRSKGN